MKIVVINLEHAVERCRRVSAALDELGLEFELFRAVDGRCLTPGQEALIDYDALNRQGWPMRAGALGNWLSHRAILSGMIENGPEAIAVLEDDIEPAPDLPAVLEVLERSTGSFGAVGLADPLFRLRRRWFFLHEGVAKRAALTRLAVKALGPAQGLRALLGPGAGGT